jgi:dihydroorotate dehydrogenase
VFTAGDVLERLEAGADLVQVYTAFIYEGPGFVPRLLGEIRARLQARGITALSAVRAARAA